MFFNKSALKQMMKTAYKGPGLYVGRGRFEIEPGSGVRDCFFIAGPSWMFKIDVDLFPKEARAMVVELCGELPETDAFFCARSGEPLQHEIWQDNILWILEKAPEELEDYRATGITMNQGIRIARVLQSERQDPEQKIWPTVLLDDRFVKAIDRNAIDIQGGEDDPRGPYRAENDSDWCYWVNDACIFACLRLTSQYEKGEGEETGHDRMIRHLERVRIEV